MIEWTSGDLFAATDLRGLGHGCNCAGAMGAGIAVEFRRRWPAMYDEYHQRCFDGRFEPGDVFTWEAPGLVVFNLGTQKTWRTKATLAAVETSVSTMMAIADERELGRVGVPRIGAGLAGLEWSRVREALERVAEKATTTLVVFETFIAAGATDAPARRKPRGRSSSEGA